MEVRPPERHRPSKEDAFRCVCVCLGSLPTPLFALTFCLPTYLPPTYLPACPPTYLPPTYLPADLPAYLPTYLPADLPTYLPTSYLPTYRPSQPTNDCQRPSKRL